MAKHSPAPWRWNEYSGELVDVLDRKVVWYEHNCERVNVRPADAALIAAAPTMAAEIVELKKRLALVGAQLRSKDAELQSKGGA